MNRNAWFYVTVLFLLNSYKNILRIFFGGSIIKHGFWIVVDLVWCTLFIRAWIYLLKREVEKPEKQDWVERAYKYFCE